MTKNDLVLHGVAFIASYFETSMIDVDTTRMIADTVLTHVEEIEAGAPYADLVFQLELNLIDEISFWREGEE